MLLLRAAAAPFIRRPISVNETLTNRDRYSIQSSPGLSAGTISSIDFARFPANKRPRRPLLPDNVHEMKEYTAVLLEKKWARGRAREGRGGANKKDAFMQTRINRLVAEICLQDWAKTAERLREDAQPV